MSSAYHLHRCSFISRQSNEYKIEPKNTYRVVVIGGGPAGSAAALTLAGHGINNVLLVEAGNYESIRVGESIPPDTRLLFEKLGIGRDFLKEGHEVCYGSCSSWGSDRLGYNDFVFNPLGNGWHLDRRRFDAFMAAKSVEAGVTLLTNTGFEQAERIAEAGFLLSLRDRDGSTRAVHADYVVDATGRQGSFAGRMGAERIVLDRLICVYGFFELTPSSQLSRLTMLEAVEDGWWYAARLPGGGVAAALASDPEIVKGKGLTSPEGWNAGLRGTRYIADALESCRFIEGSLKAWPALSFILDRVVGDRWIAVGDAASSYDPISSQGIHKGLASGIRAGEAIVKEMSGEKGRFDAYQEFVRRSFENYTANRDHFYGMENRWPESTFWTRRKVKKEIAIVE